MTARSGPTASRRRKMTTSSCLFLFIDTLRSTMRQPCTTTTVAWSLRNRNSHVSPKSCTSQPAGLLGLGTTPHVTSGRASVTNGRINFEHGRKPCTMPKRSRHVQLSIMTALASPLGACGVERYKTAKKHDFNKGVLPSSARLCKTMSQISTGKSSAAGAGALAVGTASLVLQDSRPGIMAMPLLIFLQGWTGGVATTKLYGNVTRRQTQNVILASLLLMLASLYGWMVGFIVVCTHVIYTACL